MNSIKLFLISVFSINSFGLSCPLSLTNEQIALKLVEVEFSGVRVSDMENSYCLKQSVHPNILVSHDPPVEEDNYAEYYVKSDVEVKIVEVKLLDKDSQSYEAIYKYSAKSLKGKEVVLKSSLRFMKNTSEVVKKSYGCAGVLEGPKVTAIYKRCKK